MSAIDDLSDELARLPGIGRKTALRLAFHLLKAPSDDARRLARAIVTMRERVRPCDVCGNLTEASPCPICANPRRDGAIVCVVEEASDIMAIERTGEYRGMYHVLGGRLSPLDGIGPAELNVEPLVRRAGGGEVREVVLATNPSVEGEATAAYLGRLLGPLGVRVTRIARGLQARQHRRRALLQQRARLPGQEVAQQEHGVHAGRHAPQVLEGGQAPQRVRAEQVALAAADLVAHQQHAQRGHAGHGQQRERRGSQDSSVFHGPGGRRLSGCRVRR